MHDPNRPSDEAVHRIKELDRVVEKGFNLPTDRALTSEEVGEVRQLVRDAIQQWGVSIHQLARELGRSEKTIQNWINASSPGTGEKLARKLNNWIENTARRRRHEASQAFVETWIASEAKAVVALAHRRGMMAAITSPSGTGKTLLCNTLADLYNGAVLSADRDFTPANFTRAIAEALGIRIGNKRTDEIKREVINELRTTGRVVFIDEAQCLDGRCSSTLRSIYDKSGAVFVLMGSHSVFDVVDDRSSGGGQLSRRVVRLDILSRCARTPHPDDPSGQRVGRPLYTKEEIKRFLASRQVRLTREAFELMTRIMNLPDRGCAGLASAILATIDDIYPDPPVTREQILSVLPILMDAEADYVIADAEDIDKNRAAVMAS